MKLSKSTILIETPYGEMPTYLVYPEGSLTNENMESRDSSSNGERWPGIVVLHDAEGMSNDLKRQTEWLATEGYFVAAPNLYYWGGKMRCMFSLIRSAMKNEGRVFEEIESVRKWLSSRPQCGDKIGIVGFCMGGGLAVLLSPNEGYSAASVNYGGLTAAGIRELEHACPIVGSYGGKDKTLRGVAEKLERILSEANVPHDIKEYPDASHGFMNDHHDDPMPWIFEVLSRWSKTGYHDESAKDARRRILAFFEKHLSDADVAV